MGNFLSKRDPFTKVNGVEPIFRIHDSWNGNLAVYSSDLVLISRPVSSYPKQHPDVITTFVSAKTYQVS